MTASSERLIQLRETAALRNGHGDEPSINDMLHNILEVVEGIAEKQAAHDGQLKEIADKQDELAASQKNLDTRLTRLECDVVGMNARLDMCLSATTAAVDATLAHTKHMDDLRYEVNVLATGAKSARADAEASQKAANAIGEMLLEREREHRRERPSSPSLPAAHNTQPAGHPQFESDAPPPSTFDPVPE